MLTAFQKMRANRERAERAEKRRRQDEGFIVVDAKLREFRHEVDAQWKALRRGMACMPPKTRDVPEKPKTRPWWWEGW